MYISQWLSNCIQMNGKSPRFMGFKEVELNKEITRLWPILLPEHIPITPLWQILNRKRVFPVINLSDRSLAGKKLLIVSERAEMVDTVRLQ